VTRRPWRRRLRRIRNWFRSATTPNLWVRPYRAVGSAQPIAPEPDPTMMIVAGSDLWPEEEPRVFPLCWKRLPPGRRVNEGRFR
jgi:hypothetical protein